MSSCVGIPPNVKAVDNFNAARYLGTWYEIARLDHSFEKGLKEVTATYTQAEDGSITVVNQGVKEDGKASRAVGKAYLVDQPNIGRLKVSFFGPFYSGYNIIALDHDGYQYAMVCGNSFSYFWILSRKPVLEKDILDKLLAQAKALGVQTETLIYPQKAL